jgi:hypothetical protein
MRPTLHLLLKDNFKFYGDIDDKLLEVMEQFLRMRGLEGCASTSPPWRHRYDGALATDQHARQLATLLQGLYYFSNKRILHKLDYSSEHGVNGLSISQMNGPSVAERQNIAVECSCPVPKSNGSCCHIAHVEAEILSCK